MGTITVDIDTDDVLDQLTDKEIEREFRSREIGGSGERSARQVVVDAIAKIRIGRSSEANTMLEREFLPKWRDADECRRAYEAAMTLREVA